MLLLHALPGGLVAVLEVQPLAIGATTENDGVAPLAVRPEDVASQHQPVVHRDRHVPIDPHFIADLADLTVTHGFLLRKSLERWGDRSSHLLGNDRQQTGCAIGTGVQRHIAAEDCRWAIARIVVSERADTSPNLAKRLQADAGLAQDVVGAAHRQREPIALRQHDAGRPDLDVDLVDLSGRELLLLVVG